MSMISTAAPVPAGRSRQIVVVSRKVTSPLWGLAEAISETLHHDACCTRFDDAVGRGRKRLTPSDVDALRRLVEEDLRLHRAELPGGYRTAYDVISRGLDVPADVTATGSASVRRTLAHRVRRDRFRGAS
ncbi:hypothetical protein J7E90_00325 [Streptomyces sp. ISL-111]|uniref:hypothetical protein n=1 Tax=unclassified Streptomyces TaxID=2593676 RepID=UPI000AB62DE2|nr:MULTISPECIES: hypothetical protein [unclassified Streptomyces]MBT2375866.1 hypothetical protein [Streptomyces sp. ISL-111]